MATSYSRSGSTSTTTTSSRGGSTSKSYASGKVSDNTQKNKDKYSQDYKQSDLVNNTYQQLQGLQDPGEFKSQYEGQMNDLYNKFVNREDFNFDVNENVMYQQLKDQYSALGKLAMQDTMGQAAGMTGGYGSSYSQTAGQQTYQNYMQQLQEQIPGLYEMELNRYNQEGEQMLNEYNLAKNLYDTEYGEHRDAKSDYYTDRDYFNSLYQDERAFDYGQYQDNRNYWTNEYWNEKNAETTTDTSTWEDSTSTTNTSSWSSSTSSGGGGGGGKTSGDDDKKTSGSTNAPLSTQYTQQVLQTAMGKSSKGEAEKYVQGLYASGNISEANLNYFLDQIDAGYSMKWATKGMY